MPIDTIRPEPRPMTPRKAFTVDAIAMFVYLMLVNVWAVRLYPLGRDYAALADRGAGMPFIAGRLFAWEIDLFGASSVGYHVVNLVLLYACMLCLYRFTRLAVKGYLWLGTLAATLFMANPVHSEAVLNLSGVADLVPCLAALFALMVYAEYANKPRGWKYAAALASFALAVLPYTENSSLILVVCLFELFVTEDRARDLRRLLPFWAIAILQWLAYSAQFNLRGLSPAQSFAPLYLVFYPIGLLPETVRQFHNHPSLGYLSAAIVVLVVGLIYRKARRPAILFGLFSMLAVRVFQGVHAVDPVHLGGGGRLLLANAFFNIAFVAVCFRAMDHPKWRKFIVLWTTLLCVLSFGLQIQTISNWYRAGAIARAFQAKARAANKPIGIVPDYQYYRDAPIQLFESVAHDTPFGKAVAAQSLLPLNFCDGASVAVENRVGDFMTVRVSGVSPLCALCSCDVGKTNVNILELGKNYIRFSIRSLQGQLPALLLPL